MQPILSTGSPGMKEAQFGGCFPRTRSLSPCSGICTLQALCWGCGLYLLIRWMRFTCLSQEHSIWKVSLDLGSESVCDVL